MSRQNHIILFFGSFNPIHNGHTSVAEYVVKGGYCDELWFVVSPQNPVKNNAELAPDSDRLAMTRIAVSEMPEKERFQVSDIEFPLPKPSYTIDTLKVLKDSFPDCDFSLLVGADIPSQLPLWKDHGELTSDHRFFVYPRKGYAVDPLPEGFTYLQDAPRFEFSSTDVRKKLMSGEDISGMVSPGVLKYIREKHLWQNAADHTRMMMEMLTEKIAGADGEPMMTALMERGLLYYRSQDFGNALNDFLKVLELDPANREARQYEKLIRDIFEFRHMDYYNP